MPLPPLPDYPSEPTASGGRIYEVSGKTKLIAYGMEDPLPGAPDGFVVYAFFEGSRVGRWDWAADVQGLRKIMQAYRRTTSPDYDPPEHSAPGGERPVIRPATQDLLKRAMDAARPAYVPPHALGLGMVELDAESGTLRPPIRLVDDEEG